MTDSDPIVPVPAGDAFAPVEPASASAPETAPPPVALIPEDLRVPWTWTDVFIFLVFAVGGMVVLEYALQSFVLSSGRVSFKDLPAFVTSNTPYVSVRQFLWFMMLLGFLMYSLRLRRTGSFWNTIGWRRPRTGAFSRITFYPVCLFAGALLAIVIATASGLFAPKQPLPIQQYFLDRQSIYLMSVMAILVAPIVEETIFRGFLYPVFARTLGIGGGIVLTGTLFGLMHAQQLWGGWWQIGLLVLVGLVFTSVRARAGSVVPSYLFHLGYNAIQFVGFFLSQQFHNLPLVK
jgi:membrane protease YdiL (CAAX protease family)